MRVERGPLSRWTALTSGVVLELAGGSPYSFPVYAQALKSTLRLNQRELNIASSLGNVGSFIGVFGGLAVARWGPSNAVRGGAVLALVGYTGLWCLTKVRATYTSLCPRFRANPQEGVSSTPWCLCYTQSAAGHVSGVIEPTCRI
jgi:hypothetical protein